MTVVARPVPFLRRFAAAVVSALSVALIALAAVSVLFFGGSTATLGQLINFFLGSTLIAAAALAVLALVGSYRTWYLRLIGGKQGEFFA